jgi:plastocyanin
MSEGHRPVSRRLTLIVVAALAVTLMAVGSAQAKTVTAFVGAGGDKVNQAPVNVVQGDTVVFRFEDQGHDMGLGGPESTSVGEQRKDFRMERTLDRPGTYSFACSLHDDMTATFEVAPAPGAGPNNGRSFDEVDIVVDPDGRGGNRLGAADASLVTIEEGQTVHWNWGKDSYDVQVAGRSGSGSVGDAPFRHTFTATGDYPYSTSEGSGTIRVVPRGSLNDGIRQAPAGATPAATVSVGPGNSFSPAAVTINEGEVVQWNWADGPHNVVFSDGTGLPVKTSGSGALKFFVPRATAYSYVCGLHAGMSGTVLVNDTGAAGPNEQPPPPDANVGGGTDPGSDAGSDPGPGSGSGGGSSATPSGVVGLAAAAASVAGNAPAQGRRDTTRPVLRGLRASFRRGRRAHRLRLTASEDVQLQVSLRRLGRSNDLVTRRAIRVFMRRGRRSVRLPVLNLSRGRYRLRVVALDQAGNRSTPLTLRVTVRR